MKQLILALAVGLMVGVASAQPATVLGPVLAPLDPALLKNIESAPSAFETRELSIPETKTLLLSTEGPAWRVLSVQGPACEHPRAKDKQAKKLCRELKAVCNKTDNFAHLYTQHAACSALYAKTTVKLSNDGDGRHAKITQANHAKEVAKAAVKPKAKFKPKTAKKRAKPAQKPLVHDTRC